MNKYVIGIDSKKVNADVQPDGIVIDDRTFKEIELTSINDHRFILRVGEKIYEAVVDVKDKNKFNITIDGLDYDLTIRSQLEEMAEELMRNKAKAEHSDKIVAPMPGLLLKITKEIGDEVEFGETVAVLEAMKMENEIRATSSGIIKEIHAEAGQSLEKNQLIITIE